ncbi:bHLH transcription factor RHL1-like [Hibiscus syriacus]|uniref:bHLH transcription factor RHL1-like n=1 Tax=Hibiscus syriacus TaxID=106335 RepID=UPI0019228568|nr:bHLH transcription factor RHL1-like [Hibiscus syriacus]
MEPEIVGSGKPYSRSGLKKETRFQSISKTFKATATVITTHQQKQNPELDPTSSQDDFLEQMLSILPSCSWPSDLKSPWDPPKSDETGASNPDDNVGFQYDEILASELRQHQLNGGGGGGGGSSPATEAMKMMMQQQIMLPGRGVAAAGGGGLAMPLSLDVSGAAVSRHQTDKASVLDEIIDYVKFLQLKVKVLIMSRMGGAGAVAPHVANMPSERNFNGNQTSANDDSITVTEHQVAELIEEDMGSAMRLIRYLDVNPMPIDQHESRDGLSIIEVRQMSTSIEEHHTAPRIPFWDQSQMNGNTAL